ncbi:ubiquitin-activating enzyme, putative [Plasmodium gallinaceum]|uniref:NEDD8-activating enzyme E1 catalytic subunit n=1 Tax=Plasmodium gallinaceum TaxID=5849 RepID=A0A1J1GQS6_PLAGA|nr:ubiquitin-activating enzyme, putative [Plasmodium gallinaceum]CRG93394.1 ubiquitin-activating enzyme, putative [Plasmodium gallinaceum]
MIYEFEKLNVLVVGCGGLGNEVIKNLIYINIKNITIVDYDFVEISNLQRQLFFTPNDIGNFKVNVINRIIKDKYKDVNIRSYIKKIELFDLGFFEDFDFIIGCLDNIDSRIYLNNLIFNLKKDIIYIDGGVEGFKGSIKIIDRKNEFACFNCTIENYSNYSFPICSIINKPKTPEECILYVMNVSFKDIKKEKLDKDNENHIKWIYEESKKRAQLFHINNLSYSLTEKVVKNSIPTTISTLMIISSLMITELFNIITFRNRENNYSDILYVGDNGIYMYYYKIYKSPNCMICNKKEIKLTFNKIDKLNKLVDFIKTNYNSKNINISSDSSILFISSKYLRKNYEQKLNSTFQQLIDKGEITIGNSLNIQTDKNNFILFLNLV